ncbi:iron ABC transporter membrane permease FbpB [Moraxella macacae 0408225]|uniref:Iron ABC transporter membrane permease FbpB n=2 Tax=Moraxella macacae TaxID=765840 RepID=L2F9N5_9GAMM|nr:iron ABC transporter membrane permease FbpB [Moraxella macacae 0408225]
MALVLIPVLVILLGFSEIDREIWDFLWEFQLPLLIKNTLFLMMAVGIGVVFLGTTTAWLTTMYDFVGRRVFFWAMMLPLAVPAYVLAFTQLGMVDYAGSINTFFRETYQIKQFIPDMRNGYFLSVVMSLTFYPYVYLLARNAFMSMGSRSLEVGASLGLNPMQSFFKIALPMARPWLVGGLILALMEVLADFGAVSVFGFETFSTAIYEAWFGFYSIETAKQLASLLIIFVFLLIALEQLSRGKRRFHTNKSTNYRQQLPKKYGILAFCYCGLILALAFIIPIIQLGVWAVRTWDQIANEQLVEQAMYSLLASGLSAVLIAFVAFLLALSKRMDNSVFALIASRIATLGYGIPSSVLAVGVFVPIAFIDNYLIDWLSPIISPDEPLTGVIKGTIVVVLTAYLIRFLALGLSSVEAGFERIRPSLTEACVSLGVTGFAMIWRVYLPLLKSSMGVAMLMVFVDVMKEMPMTLMTKPYDWQTLATIIYAYTSEGRFDQASLPALLIVFTGLIPVILFSKINDSNH